MRVAASPAMHFKRLPVRFDESGYAYLPDRASFGLEENARFDEARELAETRKLTQCVSFEREGLARVSPGLSLRARLDLAERQVFEAQVGITLLRECELVMRRRPPSDAIHLASRACGKESAAHALAATQAVEMVYGAVPPPLALLARNLGQCGELIGGCLQSLFLRSGPDYSAAVVSRVNPSLWQKAQQTRAPSAGIHGLPTIAEIMQGLNLQQGQLYWEAWQMARTAREIVIVLFGKYPHPTMLLPAGIGVAADRELFNLVLGRVNLLIDFTKRVVTLWHDLVEFFYDADARYHEVGATPANLLSAGLCDDPDRYDASFANCSIWGERRLSTPGVVIAGELRTTRLAQINLGLEEFVTHAYYEQWPAGRCEADPFGAPLSPYHPWNKETLPQTARRDWAGKYSWGVAARWDREAMETGALARLWITVLAGKLEHDFIGLARDGCELELPGFQSPLSKVYWRLPARPNALERLRARAFQVAYSAVAAFSLLLRAFELLRREETLMSAPYAVPERGLGVGFGEGARGAIFHHLLVEGGEIANYQINSALNWLASPRDPFGGAGAIEAALLRTPILEEFSSHESFTGIDLLRALRSFDP